MPCLVCIKQGPTLSTSGLYSCLLAPWPGLCLGHAPNHSRSAQYWEWTRQVSSRAAESLRRVRHMPTTPHLGAERSQSSLAIISCFVNGVKLSMSRP